MGAGTSKSSRSKKRPRPKHHKKINKHKIGDLHLDHYEIDTSTYRSLPCKIAIIGPARSGKSALFHRFLKNQFHARTTHDTAANVGLRMVEYERSPPVWFELWDLPTHVPSYGGPPEGDDHHYGATHDEYNADTETYMRMNAWEAHNESAYQQELRREHTDPNTGLISLLKKDHVRAILYCIYCNTILQYYLL